MKNRLTQTKAANSKLFAVPALFCVLLLALAIPFAWIARRRMREMLSISPVLTFLAIAAPWYALCWARNGPIFWRTIFWEQQVGRFTSAALQHAQGGTNPVLIRIDTKSGHGASSTTKSIEQAADIYSFIFRNLGVAPEYPS